MIVFCRNLFKIDKEAVREFYLKIRAIEKAANFRKRWGKNKNKNIISDIKESPKKKSKFSNAVIDNFIDSD